MSENPKILKYFASTPKIYANQKHLEIDTKCSEEKSGGDFLHFNKNSPSNSRSTHTSLSPILNFKSPSLQAKMLKDNTPDINISKTPKENHNLPSSFNFTSMGSKLISKSAKNLNKCLEERKIDAKLETKFEKIEAKAEKSESKLEKKTEKNPDLRHTQISKILSRVKSGNKISKSKDLSESEQKARSEKLYNEHLFQTFQAIKFIKTLPSVDVSLLRQKRVNLVKRPGYECKKTLIFDLDETLVHCVDDLSIEADVILEIPLSEGDWIKAGINIRPYAKECLQIASNLFEVIVFTASHKSYADVVLDYIDPTHELIHHRLYRENCIPVEGVFIKDLRILINRRLSDLIIVDNSAYSFGYQIDNGIPIISWFDDPYDIELFNLIHYIKILAEVDDVRDINRKTFRMRTFYEDYVEEFLKGEKRKSSSPKNH